MGELSGDTSGTRQSQQIAADHEVAEPKADGGKEGVEEAKGVPTDVEGIFAAGEKGGEPVFDVMP